MEDMLRLPVLVSSQADLGRLIRELDAVDNYLRQMALRQANSPADLPRISKALQETSTLNNTNLLDQTGRTNLLQSLKTYKASAKILHISFAAEPSPAFVQKMTDWLRNNIDSLLLLQVGLQPDIAAGCTVRSRNKYFDFSLRKELSKHRPELIGLISGRLREAERVAAAIEASENEVKT